MNPRNTAIALAALTLLFGAFDATAQRSGGQITISGEQIRGKGMDGKLSSNPVDLPATGKITGVQSTGGVGFWLECKANCQKQKKFSEFDNGKPENWRIPPGKWAVYPNLREGMDRTGVTVTISY